MWESSADFGVIRNSSLNFLAINTVWTISDGGKPQSKPSDKMFL
jgi:hypothetical protein